MRLRMSISSYFVCWFIWCFVALFLRQFGHCRWWNYVSSDASLHPLLCHASVSAVQPARDRCMMWPHCCDVTDDNDDDKNDEENESESTIVNGNVWNFFICMFSAVRSSAWVARCALCPMVLCILFAWFKRINLFMASSQLESCERNASYDAY